MSNIIKFVSVKENPIVLKAPQVEKISDDEAVDTSIIADILQSAQLEAGRIIEEAKEAAESFVQQAAADIESSKQQALEDGHRQGYEQGFEEGRLKAMTEMESQIQQAVDFAQRMQKVIDEEYKQRILESERHIIDIALSAVRKILAREIEENPMVVLPIVRSALEKVHDQEQITIRVSPDDFEFVMHAKIDLQMMVGREHSLSIISDRTVEHGSCVIDTSYGSVDARIDTQFEMMKKALQGVLP